MTFIVSEENKGTAFVTIMLLLGVILAACGDNDALDATPQVFLTTMASGTYRVVLVSGYSGTNMTRLSSVIAHVDKAHHQMTFTLQNGTITLLSLVPRNHLQWHLDCFTMGSHHLNEVADLSPAPLQLEDMLFNSAMVYTKCSPSRIILADSFLETVPAMVFDLH